MCFHTQQSQDAQTLENRFDAQFEGTDEFHPPAYYNAFTFPKTPIITNQAPNKIQMYSWGLLPDWAKDINYRKNTLNARIETIHEKPSFRAYTKNRCLILVDGFNEWQWLDEKGKKKQKYLLDRHHEAFAIAGLWNEWADPNTGEIIPNYTLLTTEPNAQMKKIHNRMPMVLLPEEEKLWLQGDEVSPNRKEVVLDEEKI